VTGSGMKVSGAGMEVTCAIILQDQRVLATRRSAAMPHPLKWEFPGGKVTGGETPEQCIRREIREELGVKVAVERRLPSICHRYETHLVSLIPFICHIREGTVALSEHGEYRWVPCGELDEIDWLDADVEVARMVKSILC
jgi:8-oxo-dGTP diphosphatase